MRQFSRQLSRSDIVKWHFRAQVDVGRGHATRLRMLPNNRERAAGLSTAGKACLGSSSRSSDRSNRSDRSRPGRSNRSGRSFRRSPFRRAPRATRDASSTSLFRSRVRSKTACRRCSPPSTRRYGVRSNNVRGRGSASKGGWRVRGFGAAKAFGEAGRAVFPAPTAIERDVCRTYRVAVVGRTSAVRERYYAISAERRLKHPGVVAITSAARTKVFS